MTSVNHRISQDHEKDIARRLGGHASRGSGNQWANPMDGRHDARSGPFVFAWDCKATRGKSIGVSREMLEKADEQAHEGRAIIPLRWYDDDRAKSYSHDKVVIDMQDFEEMLAEIERLRLIVEGHGVQ